MADEEHTDLKEVPELAPFDPTKKKKKKKVVIQDIVEESVDKLTEKTESLSVADGAESSFLGLKKKKKKPVETKLLNEEIGDGEEEAALKRLNSTTIRIHRFDGNTKFAPPIKE
ncbi:Eukaryotic translation initiation factor 2 subunit beta [Linum perenne]